MDLEKIQQTIDHARWSTGFDSDHTPSAGDLGEALGSLFAVATLLMREVTRLREEHEDLRARPCDHIWRAQLDGHLVCKYCDEVAR